MNTDYLLSTIVIFIIGIVSSPCNSTPSGCHLGSLKLSTKLIINVPLRVLGGIESVPIVRNQLYPLENPEHPIRV